MELRKSPDMILQAIKQEEQAEGQGKLKIFFGYAAGVGKTYAMLEAAHEELAKGMDVVAGYIEPHARPETAALTKGLETLPTKEIKYKDITLHEFDIDAALKRHPQIILVDELAHTNAIGSRHEKRYQDIEELLQAGIDVYTTVNVQHIESLNDQVASITQVIVRERIPDYIFDRANQVELVDIEPADLVKRLEEGKIYAQGQAGRALKHFFTTENLTALREIALRRMADRVNKISQKEKNEKNKYYYTKEHILVCLSSSPSNPKIIRTAARMAAAFKAQFTALFVKTSDYEKMSQENLSRLDRNMHLAETLGATIETVVGDDVPLQIAEYSRVAGVSQLVVGRSNTRGGLFRMTTRPFTDQLLQYLPNIEVHVIPDMNTPIWRLRLFRHWRTQFHLSEMGITLAIFLFTTLISIGFHIWHLGMVSIVPLYMLSVLIVATQTSGRIYSLALAALNVIAFDFLFVAPRFTLSAHDPSYGITFVILFVTALLAGELGSKIKIQATQGVKAAYRMSLLLESSQLLQKAANTDAIEKVITKQLVKLLNRDIVFYGVDDMVEKPRLTTPHVYAAIKRIHRDTTALISKNEQAVAQWVYKNNKRAGASTETLGESSCLYMPVSSQDAVFGVIGIEVRSHTIEANEINLAFSIITEGALALEKESANKKRQELFLKARNEQLRSNLLRSISHDLRTPLTSISGNADMLLTDGSKMPEEQKREIYASMYDDSIWLINLVENILSVTRIENGSMELHKQDEVLDDIINDAIHHVIRHRNNHTITYQQPEEILIVPVDARLIVQVLVNLLDNAIKYTPVGTSITISAKQKQHEVAVSVADTGQGIPDEAKERIFKMFYTAEKNVSDNRRGMGIGLSLCQSIVKAHGGTLEVSDNTPHGTVFTFTLPVKGCVI